MPRKKPTPPGPDLETKILPTQQRATETFERILEVAAATLAEVGIERLSTNLVCERAGLTPPALYRYFPNKYALLRELGQRLMDRQDALIDKWITLEAIGGGLPTLEAALKGLVLDTYELTRETAGGIWIMRAIRAVPVLQEVRLASHARVTDAQAALIGSVLPMVLREEIVVMLRVVANLVHATVEMLLEEPCDPQQVADIVAGMIASQLPRVMERLMEKAAG